MRNQADETYIEIVQDINCIPAGVYKLAAHDDDIWEFSLRGGIYFLISNACDALFRKLPTSEGKNRATEIEDFIDRYYTLLENWPKGGSFFDPALPFTTCVLPPKLAREAH